MTLVFLRVLHSRGFATGGMDDDADSVSALILLVAMSLNQSGQMRMCCGFSMKRSALCLQSYRGSLYVQSLAEQIGLL